MKTRSLFALVLAVGCNTPPMIDTDAGCGMVGTPVDQPSIGCPDEIDLGCVGAAGATLTYTTSSASCDGSPVTVTCTPASGATVTPGGPAMASCTATSGSGATATCSFPIRMRTDAPPSLTCAPATSVACAGMRTTVALAAAVPIESCDPSGTLTPPTSDAPAAGFAVGETVVTSTSMSPAGASVTCTTTVTVTDTTPPSITCPSAPTTVIRTAPDTVMLGAAPPATDGCDDMVDVALGTLPPGRGEHVVMATASDDAGNEASCSLTVRVLDVLAPEDLRVISAQIAGTGMNVTLGWDMPLEHDVEELAIERGTAMTGPFTEIERVTPDVLTYTDEDALGAQVFYRVVAYGPGGAMGGLTDVVRALAVGAIGYDIDGQTVPDVPFATTLYGVVRHPRDLSAGPYPLALFLHGNHGNCRPATGDDDCEERTGHDCEDGRYGTTPNAEGYVYLMETLAAQGHVAVSISANALNCRDDFIPERTSLILEHLRRWAAGTLTLPAPLMEATDLSRTALIGHSRGGEAVSQVPERLAASPIAGVTLASVFAIGPTDYHGNTPTGVPYFALLPSCDADVRTLEGAHMVDRGAAALDGEARGHVLFVGANHNFFNTEWRFDDNQAGFAACAAGDRLAGTAMRAGLEDLLSQWVRFGEGATLPAYLRAEAHSPVSLDVWADRGLELRFSYFSPERVVIDDFTGSLTSGLLGPITYEGFTAEVACTGTCDDRFAHVASGGRLAWQDAAARASFSAGGADASALSAISIRFASRAASINDGLESHDFTVHVVDGAGTEADVAVSDVGVVPTIQPGTRPLEVLSTVRVPLARLVEAAPTLDLSDIDRVEVVMPVPGSEQGSIWIADVELAGD